MKNINSTRILAAFTMSLLGLVATAQAQDGPGAGGPTSGNPPATQVPIDGGAALLLAGGVALGLKKLRDRRKK